MQTHKVQIPVLKQDQLSLVEYDRVSSKRLGVLRVGVSGNKVLEEKLTVLEVAGVVVVCLAMDSSESLLEVLTPPDEASDVFKLEKVLVLLDKFVTSQIAVLVETGDSVLRHFVLTEVRLRGGSSYVQEHM